MNVTDVDDKIITRARRNHLLSRYRASKPPMSQVQTLFESHRSHSYLWSTCRSEVVCYVLQVIEKAISALQQTIAKLGTSTEDLKAEESAASQAADEQRQQVAERMQPAAILAVSHELC